MTSQYKNSATLILLMLTTLLLVLLIFKSETKKTLSNKIKVNNAVKTTHIEKPPPNELAINYINYFNKFNSLEKELNNYLEDTTQKENWSVLVKNESSEIGINENKIYHGASTTKILTAISVYNKAQNRELFLDKVYYKGVTLEKNIEEMVNRSDNETWDFLNFFIGFDYLQTIGQKYGMESMEIERNLVTPKDLGNMLTHLHKNKALNQENTEKLILYMQNTIVQDRIPYYLPKNIKIAHKTGTYRNSIHDMGIVYTENPYIIVVMGTNTNRTEGTKIIRDLSNIVYNNLN